MNVPPLTTPVFLLSAIRSGSTLLRCLLNSHREICCPHELHLGRLRIDASDEYVALALETLGLSPKHLHLMLWDRVYDSILRCSGKSVLVDKSPSNTPLWRDLIGFWPAARLIILRRNPAAIVRSIVDANDGRTVDDAVELVVQAVGQLEAALHHTVPSYMLRYEDLVEDAPAVLTPLCRFLGVDYNQEMLAYGGHNHGPFVYGIGDWSEKIRAGRIVTANGRQVDSARFPQLQACCETWGYSPARTHGK